jgi:predicted amidohydrolase
MLTLCAKPIPSEFDSIINEYLKDQNISGEIPYDDTIVRNILYKAMSFISSHFYHINTGGTNKGEQPSTVTPISSTCYIIDAGKKGRTKNPKAKKARVQLFTAPAREIP